jgi:phospholipid/cholesterol/gamma-HCH transport system substrate-binding protein
MDKKRLIKAALLLIAAILILIWGYSYLKNNDLLVNEDEYFAVYQDVKELAPGNSVYINGLKVGNVAEIQFRDSKLNYLVVKFFLKKGIKVPKNSIAEIASIDLMGTKAIRLIIKNMNGEYHQSGDTLLSGIEGDLKEQVNKQILPLKLKVQDLIGSFDSVLVVINTILNDQTRQNLSQSFDHIQVTLKNLESTTFSLDTLMTTQKVRLVTILTNVETISTNLKNNGENFTKIITNFANISDTLAKANFSKVIKDADDAITKFNYAMTEINNGNGTIGKLIYDQDLYNNLHSASKNLDDLIIDIKQNPKRYIRFSAFDIGRTVIKQEIKPDSTNIKK